MPNYCWNTLKLNKKYRDLVVDKEGNVDFNIILPMPEGLNVESGSNNDTDIYVYLSERNNIALNAVRHNPLSNLIDNSFSNDWIAEICLRVTNYSRKQMDEAYKRGKILIHNYLIYGATTWYDWCKKNWGTKWNAWNTDISDNCGDTLYIHFTTAWCPPEGWLEELRKKVVPYELEWEEEGGYAGSYKCNGIFTTSESHLIEYEEED